MNRRSVCTRLLGQRFRICHRQERVHVARRFKAQQRTSDSTDGEVFSRISIVVEGVVRLGILDAPRQLVLEFEGSFMTGGRGKWNAGESARRVEVVPHLGSYRTAFRSFAGHEFRSSAGVDFRRT